MFKEFKKFAMRGNVVDMAVGIILGAAFGKIVSHFVSDILMPPVGMLLGNVNFSHLVIVLKEKTVTHAAITLNYGLFLNTVIDFIIIAFAIFIMIKQMNKWMGPKEEDGKAPSTKSCPKCFSSIHLEASRCPACTSELN